MRSLSTRIKKHERLLNQIHQERMAAVATVADAAISVLTIDHAVDHADAIDHAFRHLRSRLPKCFDKLDMFM